MNFVLNKFYELVYGQLSPMNANGNDTAMHLNFLKSNFPECNRLTLASFKTNRKQVNLVDRKELCCIHPTISRFMVDQLPLFQDTDLTLIHPDCLSQLQIDPKRVTVVKYQKQSGKVSYGFMEKCLWDTLSENNLRYYFYCGVLKQEQQKVFHALQSGIHKLSSREEIEIFIHQHQQSIISLCMQVLKQPDFKKKFNGCSIREQYALPDIYELIYVNLEKILRFIEMNYRSYINGDIAIPFQSRLLEESGILRKVEAVQSVFLELELSSEFKSIILTPIFTINRLSPHNRITYNQFLYIDAFLNQFYDLIKFNPCITEQQILHILFQVNYNAPELIIYLTDKFKQELLKISDPKLQLDYLYRNLKEINQQITFSQLTLHPNEPGLKVQLSCWIEEEIQYLNINKRVLTGQRDLFSQLDESDIKKLAFSLSVPELALLFRAMYEAGMVLPENQSDLFEFIANHLRSKRSDSISALSVKQRYYTPDAQTIRSLSDQLRVLLRYLENY